jgi:acetoin utilization protein AcuB
MNINLTLTKDYIKYDDFAVRKNKPNSNPISEKPKMNANAFSQKDYENKTAFRLQKNKPKQTQNSAESLLNLSINLADSTNCNVPTPRLISGTGYSYLGRRKIPLSQVRKGNGMANEQFRLIDLIDDMCEGKDVFFRSVRLVEDIMSHDIKTLTLDDTVKVCLKFMKVYKVRHVPIMEIPTEKDGKPYFVGIVSQRDLFRQISPYMGKIGEEEKDLKALQQTLGQVVTRNPRSASPQTPIPEMITFMVEDRIDMVPVLDDGDMVGIVTSADIVKLFVRLGAIRQLHVKAGKVGGTPQGGNSKNKQLLDLLSGGSDEMADVLSSVLRTVEDVMTDQVVSLEEQDNLAKAMDVMQEGKFRHVLIVDREGRLTGIISDRDILRYLPIRSRQSQVQGAPSEQFRSRLFDVAPEDASLGLPVKNIMSREVVHVLPTCSFYDAVKMLHEMKISCLPVVDEEKKLRGIVTATDVMRGLLAAYKLTAKSEV